MKVGDFARILTSPVPFLQLERIMDDAVACSIILVTIPMYTLALIRRRKVNWLHNSSNLFIGTYGGSLAIIIKSQEAVGKLIIMK